MMLRDGTMTQARYGRREKMWTLSVSAGAQDDYFGAGPRVRRDQRWWC